MTKELLTCVGGPLNGRETSSADPFGFVYLGSRYVRATDDCGERYWRFVGVVGLAA